MVPQLAHPRASSSNRLLSSSYVAAPSNLRAAHWRRGHWLVCRSAGKRSMARGVTSPHRGAKLCQTDTQGSPGMPSGAGERVRGDLFTRLINLPKAKTSSSSIYTMREVVHGKHISSLQFVETDLGSSLPPASCFLLFLCICGAFF